MSDSLVKKLTLYCLECVQASGKSSKFNNIKSDKENKIIITNDTSFKNNNREIIELQTLAKLNKNTMSLIYGYKYFIEGKQGKNTIYTPLLYTDNVELTRECDNIVLNADLDTLQANINVISSLLDNDSELIENIINEIMQIDDLQQVDFKAVIEGLLGDNLQGLRITSGQNALILAKIPDNSAGVINELKKISELY